MSQAIIIKIEKGDNKAVIIIVQVAILQMISCHLLTMVNSAKPSISKFLRRIETISGFLKFTVAEHRHSKVGTALFKV
jgi:hypothetical protein